jgi:hypothetical protein
MVEVLKRAIHFLGFQIHAITFPGGWEKDLFPLPFCGSDWPYSLQPTYIINLSHFLKHFSIYWEMAHHLNRTAACSSIRSLSNLQNMHSVKS